MNPVFAKKPLPEVTLQDKPLAEPDPVYGQGRPMTGFFAQLTPAQKALALAYRGEENHGDPEGPKQAT
jgi:hypothetical protein